MTKSETHVSVGLIEELTAEEIENRIWAAIDRAREQPSSIPDVDRLFASLKSEFQQIGVVADDPEEGERVCVGLMFMTLKMLMPTCKAIMGTFASQNGQQTESWGGLFEEQQRRAAELVGLYNEAIAHAKDEHEFLVRTGLATRVDFIVALACESDPSHSADFKVWLNRLEPYWHNNPKMTFAQARALWETDQRRA
jgi:hypothetical protein